MAYFIVFDQHFYLCQEVQIFVKKSWELHIVKCISHSFQELFSEVNYLYYFLKHAVIEFYKREKTYCSLIQSLLWKTCVFLNSGGIKCCWAGNWALTKPEHKSGISEGLWWMIIVCIFGLGFFVLLASVAFYIVNSLRI